MTREEFDAHVNAVAKALPNGVGLAPCLALSIVQAEHHRALAELAELHEAMRRLLQLSEALRGLAEQSVPSMAEAPHLSLVRPEVAKAAFDAAKGRGE